MQNLCLASVSLLSSSSLLASLITENQSYVVFECYEFCSLGWNVYWSDTWNYFDVANYTLFSIVLALKSVTFFMEYSVVDKVRVSPCEIRRSEQQWERPRCTKVNSQLLVRTGQLMTPCKASASCSYINFWDIAYLYRMSHNINAFNAVLCFIKAFKYLEISKKLGQFTHTIALASKEMLSFMIILFVFLAGFAAAFHLGFGSELEAYKDLNQSLISLLLAMLGEFTFQELLNVNSYLGPVLFGLYVIIVFFVILSMFLAIVDNAYDNVREEVIALGDSYVDPLTMELANALGNFTSTLFYPMTICAKLFPGDPETLASRDRELEARDERAERAMRDRAAEIRRIGLGAASLAGHGFGTDRSRAMQHMVFEHGAMPEQAEEILKWVLNSVVQIHS